MQRFCEALGSCLGSRDSGFCGGVVRSLEGKLRCLPGSLVLSWGMGEYGFLTRNLL